MRLKRELQRVAALPFCLVCGCPADETDDLCPGDEEDVDFDEFECRNCLQLNQWFAERMWQGERQGA